MRLILVDGLKAYWPSARPVRELMDGSRVAATLALKITPKAASAAIARPATMETPILIHAMMRVAVFKPAPPTAPPDALISLSEECASTRATMAAMIGHTTHDTMASTRPTIALVDVVGPATGATPGAAGVAAGAAAAHALPSQ